MEYFRASASIPVLSRVVEIDGKRYFFDETTGKLYFLAMAWRSKSTINTDISAGFTPPILDACAKFTGLIFESFSFVSVEI